MPSQKTKICNDVQKVKYFATASFHVQLTYIYINIYDIVIPL